MSQEFATTAAHVSLDFTSKAKWRAEGEDAHAGSSRRRARIAASATQAGIDIATLAPLSVFTLLFQRGLQSESALACAQAGLVGAVTFAAFASLLPHRDANIPKRTRMQLLQVLSLWGLVVAAVYGLWTGRLAAEGLPSTWALSWFAMGAFGVVGSRLLWGERVQAAWHPDRAVKRVALVGSASETQQLCAFLERSDQRRAYSIAGVFIDEAIVETDDDDDGFHKADTLPFVIGALKVDTVIAAPPWGDRAAVNRMCERLRAVPANVHLLTEIAEVNPVPLSHHRRFAGRVMVELWTLPLATWRAWLKRTEDFVISLALLIALAPTMAVIALLIRLETPGPVIFRQLRYGFANRPIRVSKFRTMRQDLGDAGGAWATVRNDPRVTRVGAFLRRTSLDELPQLFDVLRGDISLVGPRAHPVEMRVDGRYYADAVKSYAARHLVKPGMTGLAQINGCRGHIDSRAKAERRVDFDLKYIETWSLKLDLWILWRSVFVGFINENAY